jgi:PAS domain-containing protein
MIDDQMTTSKLRQRTTAALLGCYLIPLLLLTFYNTSQLPLHKGWVVLSGGLLSALGGATILFLLLRQWETRQSINDIDETEENAFSDNPPTESELSQDVRAEIESLADSLADSQRQCEKLAEEIHVQQRVIEAVRREKDQVEVQFKQLQQTLATHKESSHEDLLGKETLIAEYQQTITDQRAVIEKKQQSISSLEAEIRDLKYELKTLVDISDKNEASLEEEVVELITPPTPALVQRPPDVKPAKAKVEFLDLGLAVPSKSTEEAHQQLKRCIDIAQKLTGARHLAGDSSRFRDLSADGYALDLRRLCDSFRSEHSCMIVLYSQRENKILFVNNQVRGMLGLSPDKFLQNFPQFLAQESVQEWKGAINKASIGHKAETTLRLKDHTVRCLLGAIPTGIFKTHIVGILYPEVVHH